MMNWIYNWYDPRGTLAVRDLVDNLTRLFLHGFTTGDMSHAQPFKPKAAAPNAERLSVWRVPQG